MAPHFRSMERETSTKDFHQISALTSPLKILIIVNLRQTNESLRTTVPDIQSTTCLSGVQYAGDQRCPSGHKVTGHHISMPYSVFRGTEVIWFVTKAVKLQDISHICEYCAMRQLDSKDQGTGCDSYSAGNNAVIQTIKIHF